MSRPPSLPILRLIRGALRPLEDRAQVALEILSHGDLVRVPFPGKRVYFTKSPADFRHVLSDNAAGYQKSFDYRLLAELVGDGLIASEADVWRRDRRMIQPLFHQKMVAHFGSRITQVEGVIDTQDTFATACNILSLHPDSPVDGKPITEIFEQAELLHSAR